MTLLITREISERGTLLLVAGDVSGAERAELEACCLGAAPPLTLNLEGVTAVDSRGLEVLVGVAANGARIFGASPYVVMRLERRLTK